MAEPEADADAAAQYYGLGYGKFDDFSLKFIREIFSKVH